MGDTPDIKKSFQEILEKVVIAGESLVDKNNTFHQKVEDELQEIVDKLDQLEINFRSVLRQIGDLNNEKTENQDRIGELNEKIISLTEEKDTQKVAMDADIQERNAQIDALKANLTTVQAANEKLIASGNASEAEKKVIEEKRLEIEQRIQGLEDDLSKKISENEELNKTNIDMIAKHQSEINDLKQQNEKIDDLLKLAIEELNKIMEIINGLSKGKKYEKIDTIKGKIDKLLGLVSTDVKSTDVKSTDVNLEKVYNNDENSDNKKLNELDKIFQSIQLPNVSEMTQKYKGKSTPQPGENAERIHKTERNEANEANEEDDFSVGPLDTAGKQKERQLKMVSDSKYKENDVIMYKVDNKENKGKVTSIQYDPNSDNIKYIIDGNINIKPDDILNKINQEGGKKKTRKNKTAKRKKRVTKKKRGSNKKAKKFTQRKKR